MFDLSPIQSLAFFDRVEHHATITSTNDRSRLLAAELPKGSTALVIADEQTAGRGRGANRWWTGGGSLAFSVLFDPAGRKIERRYFAMIALGAAVAIVDTIEPLVTDRDVGLHWPNDVFVGDRKLAGILVESLPDGRHIVGIGVNVNNSVAGAPNELAEIVTTLADLTGQKHDRVEVLATLLTHFHTRLVQLAESPASLGERSHQLCLQRGRRLTVEWANRQTTGICTGIANDGGLMLDTPAGPQVLYSGVILK
jgi:BirA family biotin operon repressor/biotin-[acetyl-CoA-carboxylase] ligase